MKTSAGFTWRKQNLIRDDFSLKSEKKKNLINWQPIIFLKQCCHLLEKSEMFSLFPKFQEGNTF